MLVNYPSYQVGFKRLLSFNTKCSARIWDQARFDHCYKVKQAKQKFYDRTIWQHHIFSKETKLEIKQEVSPYGHSSNLLPLLDNICSIHDYYRLFQHMHRCSKLPIICEDNCHQIIQKFKRKKSLIHQIPKRNENPKELLTQTKKGKYFLNILSIKIDKQFESLVRYIATKH